MQRVLPGFLPGLLPGVVVAVGLALPALAQEAADDLSPEDANLAELEELMARTQARIAALSEAGTERDDALEFLTKQIEQAIGSMAGQEDTNESLKRKNADLNWEIETLLQSDAALSEKLALATEEHAATAQEMETQIAELTQMLSLEEEEKAQLIAANEDLLSKLEASDLALAEVRSAMTAEEQAAADKQEEISRLSQQVASLKADIVIMQAALVSSKRDLQQKQKDIAALEQKLDVALESQAAELTEFRSEFFARLVNAIGYHPDMRVSGDRFVFQSEVLFESGSADIGPEGQKQLAQLAKTLRELTPMLPGDLDWVLRVDGHTDRRTISTREFRSNWELSTARAITVVRFLMRHGIPPDRLAATGFGQYQPIDPTDDEIAFRRNRRIEFKLTER